MANEITSSASLTVTRSGATFTGLGINTISQTNSPSIANTQIIGTTSEPLLIGDVTVVGYWFLKNLDPSNYVEISLATPVLEAAAFVTLLPGECALIPSRIEVLYAKANSGAINLLVVAASL